MTVCVNQRMSYSLLCPPLFSLFRTITYISSLIACCSTMKHKLFHSITEAALRRCTLALSMRLFRRTARFTCIRYGSNFIWTGAVWSAGSVTSAVWKVEKVRLYNVETDEQVTFVLTLRQGSGSTFHIRAISWSVKAWANQDDPCSCNTVSKLLHPRIHCESQRLGACSHRNRIHGFWNHDSVQLTCFQTIGASLSLLNVIQ